MNTRVLLLGAVAIALYLVFARGGAAGTNPFFTGLASHGGTAGVNTNIPVATALGAPPNALAGGIATLESGLTAILEGKSLAGPGQSTYAAGSLAQGESLETAPASAPTTVPALVGPLAPAPSLSSTSVDQTNYLSGVIDSGTSLETVPPPQLPTASLAFDSSSGTIDTYFDPSQYGDLTGLAAPSGDGTVTDGGVL